MPRKVLKFLIYLAFISNTYPAKEITGYSKGIEKNYLFKINEALDNENYEKAIKLLKKEIKINKANADMHNLLGFAYRKNNNYKLSLISYKRALKIDPSHLRTHNYIGITYIKIGNLDESKKHLQKLKMLCKSLCEEYKTLNKELRNAIKKENK